MKYFNIIYNQLSTFRNNAALLIIAIFTITIFLHTCKESSTLKNEPQKNLNSYANMNGIPLNINRENSQQKKILPEPVKSKNKIHFKLKGLPKSNKTKTIAQKVRNRNDRLKKIKKKYKGILIAKSIRNVSRKKADTGVKGIKKYKQKVVRIYKATIKSSQNIDSVVAILNKDPDIEWAEPIFTSVPQLEPNDPYYSYTACSSNGQEGYLKSIKADTAWDTSTGNNNVVVAVLDFAGNYYHEDLSPNKWINTGEIDANGIDDDGNGYIDDIWGWDFVKDRAIIPESGDPDSADFTSWHATWLGDPINWATYQHGTHVGGIIGAKGNNGIGVTGVNWNVKLMLLNGTGSVEGLYYACDNGADIVNMSFASGATNALKDAVEYCYDKGVLLIAASGNSESTRRSYPAAFDHVLAIGSARDSEELSSFSHYGVWLDMVSPGEYICSTYIEGYGYESGTSMAAPVVSGVAALIKSVYPNLTPDQLVRHLYSTAKDSKSKNPTTYLGMGAGYVQAEMSLDPTNIPTKMEVVGLTYENQSSNSDDYFYKGDTIKIRPTVRNFNFSGVIEDVTLTLSLPDSVGLTASDTTIHLDHAGPNTRVASWDDTFQVTVQNSLTEFDYDQEYTITIRDGQGNTYSAKNFTIRLNPLLSNTVWLSGSGYSFYNQARLAETPDGRVHTVFSSNDAQRRLHHRVRETDGTWGNIVAIPNLYSGQQHYHQILAGPDDKLHLVYVLYTATPSSEKGIYYTWYDPTTSTWDNGVRIGDIGGQTEDTNDLNTQSSRVSIIFDSSGKLNVFRTAWTNSGDGSLYWIKHNGSSWESPELVLSFDFDYDWNSKQIMGLLDDQGYPLIIIDYYKYGSQSEGLYYTRHNGSSWDTPIVISTEDYDFSATVDSTNTIHLLGWKAGVDTKALSYRKYSSGAWNSSLPQPPNNNYYNYNRMNIVINPSDKPEIYFADGFGDIDGLYRSIFTTSWSTYSYIHRVDHVFYSVSDFKSADVLITSSDEILYAYPYQTQFLSTNSAPIMIVTSDKNKRNLIPERPFVSLSPDQSNQELTGEISNVTQFAYYFITMGIAPNEDDLGTTWESSTKFLTGYYQDQGSYSPYVKTIGARWVNSQPYYATARGIASNGYLSSMGSSHGSTAIVDFTASKEVVPPEGSSTLRWYTLNANAVSLTPGGSISVNGNMLVYPQETTTYTLTATGATGSSLTSELTINVATDLVSSEVVINPPDEQSNEYFGSKIVMDNDTMLVGSPYHDEDACGCDNTGAVYVYKKNASGDWVYKQKLEADDGGQYDHFGSSVAKDGNTIVIGSTGSDINNVARSGAAYVFEYNISQDKWEQVAKLTAPANIENQGFGASVAIYVDRIVISAGRGTTNGIVNSGSVYVFTKPGAGWINTNQSVQLTDVILSKNDRFGSDVSIDTNTIVVGAAYSGPNNAGKAYVFEYSGGNWNKTTELIASDYSSDDWDYFGNRVLIKDDTILIGSFRDNKGKGSVFVYEKGADWASATVSKLEPPRSENNNFGIDFDFNGTTIIIGQSNYDTTNGYAYLFKKNAGNWEQSNELSPPTGITHDDKFASGVAIGPGGIAIGARFKDGSEENSGIIYNYSWNL